MPEGSKAPTDNKQKISVSFVDGKKGKAFNVTGTRESRDAGGEKKPDAALEKAGSAKESSDVFSEKEKAEAEMNIMKDGVDDTFKKMAEKLGIKKPEEVKTEEKKPEGLKVKEKEEEKKARYEQLCKELEAARREYVVKDFAMDKHSSWTKKIFGFGKRAQLTEVNREFEQAKARHQAAMNAYKAVMLERDGAEKTSDWIEKGEYLNLKNVREDVKMENSSWPEKIKKGALKIVEDYRKLPLWKKLVMGGALAGVGFVSGVAGGVAAAGGAAFLTGMRIFTTGVSAIGFKGMFEGIAEKGRDKKAAKENLENIKISTNERGEIDFEKLNARLNEKIGKIDEKLQSRKNWEKGRTWMAAGTAVATTMIGRYVGGKIFGKIFGGASHDAAAHHGSGGSWHGSEVIHGSGNLDTINIPKGSSFEGALGKHLQLMGMDSHEAGNQAHILAVNYANEHGLGNNGPYSLVHEGAQIKLSPDGTKVLDITNDKNLGWLGENATQPTGASAIPESAQVDTSVLYNQDIANNISIEEFNKSFSGLKSHVSCEDGKVWDFMSHRTPDEIKAMIRGNTFPEDLYSKDLIERINATGVKYTTEFGMAANPRDGETILEWTSRLAEMDGKEAFLQNQSQEIIQASTPLKAPHSAGMTVNNQDWVKVENPPARPAMTIQEFANSSPAENHSGGGSILDDKDVKWERVDNPPSARPSANIEDFANSGPENNAGVPLHEVSIAEQYHEKIDNVWEKVNNQIDSQEALIRNSYAHSPEELAGFKVQLDALHDKGAFFQDLHESISAPPPSGITASQAIGASIRQSIFENSQDSLNADNLRFVNVEGANPTLVGVSAAEGGRINDVINYMNEIAGGKTVPYNGETMQEWVQRSANILRK